MRFIREWYMVIIPVLTLILFIVATYRQSQSASISVPVEFCKAQSTGRTKSEDIPMQSCAGYDRNMVCTVPITTWTTETRNETRVICDFIEWRQP
jgi:hypothetical protein